MSRARVLPASKRAFLIIVLFGIVSVCAVPTNTTTTAPVLQQLRIVNSGSKDIPGLVVLFPWPTADAKASRVESGDVPEGETTEYRNVPSGVYRYAAHEYTLDGRVVNQPVTDWVGESPMAGEKFTYRTGLDSKKEPGNQVQLIEVLVDEP